MFGLNEKDIESICSVFREYPEIEKAILYGSRAKGNQKLGSDIDITLKGHDLTLSLLAKVSSKLDDLPIPYKVDISAFDRIKNKDLIAHINRVGKLFFSKS